MPEGINMAFISPIFKGGGKSEPANDRPIALTSHLTKTFERILRLKMVEHLAINDLLNKSQHGFTARPSTVTQLIAYYTFVLDSMINSKQVMGILEHKLRQYGIGARSVCGYTIFCA